MRIRDLALVLALTAGLGVIGQEADAQLIIEWESGPTIVSRSDIGVPGDGGTVYAAAEDADVLFAQRIGVGAAIGERHIIGLSFAPYELETEGQFSQSVTFQESVFLAGETVRSAYQLNLYRLSYHYRAIGTDRLRAAVGVSVQLRSTRAALTGADASVAKRAWGFRPLVSARLRWQLLSPASLRVDADAVRGPGERWEDVLVAVEVEPAERFRFRAGYRLLEGRVDSDALYNASLVHHFLVGMTLTL
jgi:hypothetical protein